jgi:hypothetical protein
MPRSTDLLRMHAIYNTFLRLNQFYTNRYPRTSLACLIVRSSSLPHRSSNALGFNCFRMNLMSKHVHAPQLLLRGSCLLD